MPRHLWGTSHPTPSSPDRLPSPLAGAPSERKPARAADPDRYVRAMAQAIDFPSYTLPEPSLPDVETRYRALHDALDAADGAEAELAVLRDWDDERATLASWCALAQIRFSQDTRDDAIRELREKADALEPKLQLLDVALMKRFAASEHRARLEDEIGAQAFAVWACDVAASDDAILDAKIEEADGYARYQALVASAELPFRGETLNHPALLKYLEDPDRKTRHEAATLRWGWFAEHEDEIDALYDAQVKLRDGIGRTLGHENFVPVGYQRMKRVDYGPAEVAGYRDAIRTHVVPLAAELREAQRQRLGVDKLMAWDEPLTDPRGNPRPLPDLAERARGLFDALHPELGAFYGQMVEGGLLDLDARAGKAGGGYCSHLHELGMPFIFANFNGTQGDALVFTHEMGHAFQVWSARERQPIDLRWPSLDGAEIHSMSLEMLSAPGMERFFGDDAERFRQLHLAGTILFLPYGAAIDHFQHLVYENPGWAPAERRGAWLELERQYLPWRDAGDLPHLPDGGMWQAQLHLFGMPFYYIDYTLAQVCALQYAAWRDRDPAAALDSYVALCRRGGEAPFQTLVRDAGLTSPFDPGCLEEVVRWARGALGA